MRCHLNKTVCQKCYRYNERNWGEQNDFEWDMGQIHCPMEYFESMNTQGEETLIHDRRLRDIFGSVFGWRDIQDGLPDWCEFKKEHLDQNYQDGER
jgi:hypothetical protein